MILPKIGETITTERGLELCKHFGLHYLVKRIEKNPDAYRDWVFDGCSMFPDKLFWRLLNAGKGKAITYECCLPHDLRYAYGTLGANSIYDRQLADFDLESDLINKAKVFSFVAHVFYVAVRTGGEWNTDFKWAFARK